MKTIKISNGEIRIGYKYDDLSEVAKAKVLNEQIDFEIEIMSRESPYYYLFQEMEEMRTPWFLSEAIYHKHKDDLIEVVKLNKYLFDEEGELLPVTYHMRDNEVAKTTFGVRGRLCVIEEVENEKH